MNKILDLKYPYLTNFFETAIKENKLFHSIILYGSSNCIQYLMALDIARQLNCLDDKKEDCQCQNCRWIRENKHPEVMTISKIDNKNENDLTKTVISTQQIEFVLDKIFSPSNYHKVFIFCNADIKIPAEKEKKEYDEIKDAGFKLPKEEEGNKIWYPSSINQKCFQETSANSMLKSIEEPAEKTTFIFLTNSPNDLISTIVSRSQCFYMPYSSKNSYVADFFCHYFDKYPNFEISKALDFALALENYQNEKNLDPYYIIDCLQFYLTQLLKSNLDNKFILNKIFKDIKKTEEAKQMLKSYVKENQIYEHLAFYFAGKL